MDYYDLPSVIITIGGSIAGVLASNKLKDFIIGLKSLSLAFKEKVIDPGAVISNLIDLSNVCLYTVCFRQYTVYIWYIF